jgi:catechol-2,3-dioxygenase
VRLYIPSGGEFRLAARSHTENLTDGTMKILQRSERMSLGNYKLNTSIAVSDMARAREFYEGKLGLTAVHAGFDGSQVYASAGDTSLHVYPSAAHAGRSTATLATWYVDDVERVVEELRSTERAT